MPCEKFVMTSRPLLHHLALATRRRPRWHLISGRRSQAIPTRYLPGVASSWFEIALARLIDVERDAVVIGDALVHADIRSDNLCIGDHVKVVDWNWAFVGNPMVDIVAWLPSLHLEGGPAPWEVLTGQTPLVARLAGFFLQHGHPAATARCSVRYPPVPASTGSSGAAMGGPRVGSAATGRGWPRVVGKLAAEGIRTLGAKRRTQTATDHLREDRRAEGLAEEGAVSAGNCQRTHVMSPCAPGRIRTLARVVSIGLDRPAAALVVWWRGRGSACRGRSVRDRYRSRTCSAPGRIRTYAPGSRRPMLYPLSYWGSGWSVTRRPPVGHGPILAPHQAKETMSLTATLSQTFGDAFASLGLDPSFGAVVVSARPDLAQFQCNGAMSAAKHAGKNPREVAQAVIDGLEDTTPFGELELAVPGFINITLTDEYLAAYVDSLQADTRFGTVTTEPKKMVIDYGGPNVAKELHVGHLRPAIIGESIKRVFRFLGNDVVGDVHLGDWGMPYGQLIAELEDRLPDLPYFDEAKVDGYPETSPVTIGDLQVMYPEASTRAKADEAFAARARAAVVALQQGRPGYRALWQHMRNVSIDAIKQVFDRLNVHFDLWHGESTIHERIQPMVDRLVAGGFAYESDGALVIEVMTEEDTKEVRSFLLLKSDGGSLYTTWDLATIEDRVEELGAEEMIYVVDARQSLHFEQVFRAAYKTVSPPKEPCSITPGTAQ